MTDCAFRQALGVMNVYFRNRLVVPSYLVMVTGIKVATKIVSVSLSSVGCHITAVKEARILS